MGKRWGRHHTQLPLADPQKTWEGTCAMWVVASVVGTVTLAALGASVPRALALAVLIVPVTELMKAVMGKVVPERRA